MVDRWLLSLGVILPLYWGLSSSTGSLSLNDQDQKGRHFRFRTLLLQDLANLRYSDYINKYIYTYIHGKQNNCWRIWTTHPVIQGKPPVVITSKKAASFIASKRPTFSDLTFSAARGGRCCRAAPVTFQLAQQRWVYDLDDLDLMVI